MTDMVISTSLITYSVYSLNRLTDLEEDASNLPERVDFIKPKKNIILFLSLFSYLIALIFGGLKNKNTIPIFLIPFIMGLIYSIKISSFRLKDLFLAKNLTVSLSWALSAALLPHVFGGDIGATSMIFIFLFIKCFVNTVVFDVRDIEGDRKVRANTIPVVVGIEKTMSILLFMNSLLFVWLFICLKKNLFLDYIPAILFSIIYAYFYIFLFCRKVSKKINFDYAVDGEFIILFLLSKIF